jgi:hypothetical protein
MINNETKSAALGDWVSLATEVRPSAIKKPDGSLKPFYLTRRFTLMSTAAALTPKQTALPTCKSR